VIYFRFCIFAQD